MIKRQGCYLQKSRRRDPLAIDYGGYMIIDINSNRIVAGFSSNAYDMSLDDAERWALGV